MSTGILHISQMEEMNLVLTEIYRTSKWISSLSVYLFVFLICFVPFWGMLNAFYNRRFSYYDYDTWILVSIAAIFFFLQIVEKSKVQRMQKAVLEKHNQSFASRGLRWHLTDDSARWVELWKDYKTAHCDQPSYISPGDLAGEQGMNGQSQPQFQQNYWQNYHAVSNDINNSSLKEKYE